MPLLREISRKLKKTPYGASLRGKMLGDDQNFHKYITGTYSFRDLFARIFVPRRADFPLWNMQLA
jgi:hypothetical protein